MHSVLLPPQVCCVCPIQFDTKHKASLKYTVVKRPTPGVRVAPVLKRWAHTQTAVPTKPAKKVPAKKPIQQPPTTSTTVKKKTTTTARAKPQDIDLAAVKAKVEAHARAGNTNMPDVTIPELKALLKSMGKPVGGKKQLLVDRVFG